MATRRISIVNQKGGVGKTTTAVNLAAGLGARGKRVLLIDYDPQGNATQFLGLANIVSEPGTYGSYDFTLGKAPFAPQKYVLPGVDLLPATEDLSFMEETLLDKLLIQAPMYRLATSLDQVASQYDFVLADCGPTVGMTAINAMLACPEVLVPIELQYASVPGALKLYQHIQRLKASAEPRIHILGVLGTKLNDSARTPREVLGKLREIFGDVLFETSVHTSQAVADAAAKGSPILLANPGARGAIQYDKLTDEVLNRG